MKHVARLTAVMVLASLALTSPAVASINLNSSRSNVYRVYHPPFITDAQAIAILNALDNMSGMNEDAIKAALPQLLKKNGVDLTKVKETVVRSYNGGKSFSIILLDESKDLPAALAVSDKDAPPPDKPAPKTKPKTSKQ
jgi:hypothetical protein